MVKLFGVQLNPQMALVLLLIGIGVVCFASFELLILGILYYQEGITAFALDDWAYLIIMCFALGIGIYMLIVGFMGRKRGK